MSAKRRQAPERPTYPAVVIPVRVLDSVSYRALPASAKALLVDIVRMHDGYNNGRISVSPATRICKGGPSLADRGWRSDDVLYRARDALLKSGLLIRARRGGRNSGPDLFALSWLLISNGRGLDIQASDHNPLPWIDGRFGPAEIADAVPESGAGSSGIRSSAVPESGAERLGSVPESGAREGDFATPAVPESGDYVNVAKSQGEKPALLPGLARRQREALQVEFPAARIDEAIARASESFAGRIPSPSELFSVVRSHMALQSEVAP